MVAKLVVEVVVEVVAMVADIKVAKLAVEEVINREVEAAPMVAVR